MESENANLLNKLHSFRRTEHKVFLISLPIYMHVTCFDPFSGHHQARQYKIL